MPGRELLDGGGAVALVLGAKGRGAFAGMLLRAEAWRPAVLPVGVLSGEGVIIGDGERLLPRLGADEAGGREVDDAGARATQSREPGTSAAPPDSRLSRASSVALMPWRPATSAMLSPCRTV